MTKEEKRKLEQIEKRKKDKKDREECFDILEKTKISEEQRELLYKSSNLGKEETSKQKIERAKRELKAGIPVSVDLDSLSSRFKLKKKNWKDEWNEEAEKELYGQIPFEDQSDSEEEKVEEEIKEQEVEIQEKNDEIIQEIEKEEKSEKNKEEPFLTFDFSKGISETKKVEKEEKEETEDDEEPQTKREMILKEFETLIDMISAEVQDKELASKLIIQTTKLMDIVVEDSDDEGEGENEQEQEYIPQEPIVVPPPKTDTELIKEMIEEADAKKAPEEKEIKYTKYYVLVERDPEIQEQREKLPIYAEEQPIMEAVEENDIIIICGETGSGKTTQIPQFLYEAGYSTNMEKHPGMICVTQPRRVAAVSTSQRVAQELNCELGKLVGYHVRYDNKLSKETKIKFVTDGILMQEIENDPLLLKYSAIVLDEAHERNINTDILIGWLSRFIPQRNKMAKKGDKSPDGKLITPLKLIIMSATLRVKDFTENQKLFPVPPIVINIQSRQFPVTVHFNKKTDFGDYVGACFNKICKIHNKLPNGGILVILTGKDEIDTLVKKLKDFSENKESELMKEQIKMKSKLTGEKDIDKFEEELIMGLGDLSDDEDDKVKLFEDNIKDEKTIQEGEEKIKEITLNQKTEKLHVLPLYSMLSPDKQLEVFKPPPEGHRLVVVSTNVSETSLTIPGIRYVVDSGRVKDKEYDKKTGISKYVIKWVSKASANQRAGRSGRTGPGHCYRLYSAAVFDNQFAEFNDPDIVKIPIENVILQMKNMGIQNIPNFPFPTPPDSSSIKSALRCLINIGAIDKESSLITKLGKELEKYPVHPRLAKMLALSNQNSLLDYMIIIVSAITVQQIFLNRPESEIEENKKYKAVKKKFEDEKSDLLAILKAVGGYEFAKDKTKYCQDNFLHIKNMKEVHSLRQQLIKIQNGLNEENGKNQLSYNVSPSTADQDNLMRQIICAGYVDQVARLATNDELEKLGDKLKRGNRPYISQSMGLSSPLYIHPSSYLVNKYPKYIVYTELTQSQSDFVYMRSCTEIEDKWLAYYGIPLSKLSEPLSEKYNPERDRVTCFVEPTFGDMSWKLSTIEVDYPSNKLGSLNIKRGYEIQLFLKYLIEGKVFTDLSKYKDHLTHSPNELLNLNPPKHSKKLLEIFKEKSILSKSQLVEIWKNNPTFLKKEYSEWLKPKALSILEWPPKN